MARQPSNAELWNERGVALHQAGRREEARGSYRRAVDADPSYALAWNNLGVAAAGDPDNQAAVDAFQAALRTRPDFTGARLNLGLVLLQRHEPQADRQSTRLNSSHLVISYAVFCLKKKIKTHEHTL